MNILILSGRFGMGHIKAAAAIEEKVRARGEQVHVQTVDLVSYLFPHTSNSIYGGFHLMVSYCAELYNMLKKAVERTGAAPLKKASCRKIHRLLAETKADLIISVLPICTQYFAAYKQISGCQLPLYTYITDIPFHKEWYADACDRYFVGARSTKEALLFQGVPAESITVCGIPVLSAFCESSQKKSQISCADAAKKRLLLMGGGFGLLPLHEKILLRMQERSDWEITVITGNNHRLRKYLQRHFPQIQALGFVDNVCDYMQRADLLITKPGGISTFEAIAARLPLFVIDPLLEQEIGNAQFIETAGFGTVIWGCGSAKKALSDAKADEILNRMSTLLSSPLALRQCRTRMQGLSQSFDSFCPLDYYKEEGKNYNVAL